MSNVRLTVGTGNNGATYRPSPQELRIKQEWDKAKNDSLGIKIEVGAYVDELPEHAYFKCIEEGHEWYGNIRARRELNFN